VWVLVTEVLVLLLQQPLWEHKENVVLLTAL
jgi:hypothetical protein